jgi:hypothetical protein
VSKKPLFPTHVHYICPPGAIKKARNAKPKQYQNIYNAADTVILTNKSIECMIMVFDAFNSWIYV